MKVTTGRAAIRRLALADVDAVVGLVQAQIDEDIAAGRDRRLGPISEQLLRLSLEQFGGLSTVLEDQESGEIRGCALVMAFEALEDTKGAFDFMDAEAAKLTVRRPFVGTEGASVLHALRVASVALHEIYDDRPLTLYYNVLSGNERQLEYMRSLDFEPVTPGGHLALLLDQRRRKIDLGRQEIYTFKPSQRTIDDAVKILLEAAADRVLKRVDRDSVEPHLQAWELMLDHPLLNDELAILVDFARERHVAVPKHVSRRLSSDPR